MCIFFGTASIFYSFLQFPGTLLFPAIEHFSIFRPLMIVSVAPAAEAGTARTSVTPAAEAGTARMIHQADMQAEIGLTGCQKCAFHRQLSTFCNILDYFNK